MGDIDNKPDKEFKSQKPLDACTALSREVEATQMHSLSPIRVMSEISTMSQANAMSQASQMRISAASIDGYLDFSTDKDVVARKKCDSYLASHQETVEKLDFDKEPIDKKTIDKKLFDKKLFKDPPDFAPIPLLAPSVAGFMDRVDRNHDGNMTSREINSALNGADLNKKEKYILNVLKENKHSIDNDKNGISIADMKEFDSKITRYQKEMTLARKYVPELSEFTRELHQRGKLADDNRDGRFSKEELTSFYIECKKEFLANPTSQGKRELSALNWGVNNYDRYATMTGRPGGEQITVEWLQTQMLREMDREVSPGLRQYFLSPSDRLRVERYQNSR